LPAVKYDGGRVAARMWPSRGANAAESRRGCGRVVAQMWPSCGADVGRVAAQMWADALLEPFVREVDAQLLERVVLEAFEAEDVEDADEAEVAARGALGALDEAEPHGPAEDLRSSVEPLGADRRGPHCKRCRAALGAQRYDYDAPTAVVSACAEGVRVRVFLCAHVCVCVRGRAAATAKGGAGGGSALHDFGGRMTPSASTSRISM